MKTLQKIISEQTIETPYTIMYRVTTPQELVDEGEPEDMLFGYCEWDGENLNSLDGDNYSLNDEIINHYIHETESGELVLCVVTEGNWATFEDFENDEDDEIDAFDDIDTVENAPKEKKRALRRHNDYKKAVRKRKIAKAVYTSSSDDNWEYYDNLHQYSKNKIHCSCPMCRAKTNAKKDKGSGQRFGTNSPVKWIGPSWGSTTHRMKDNYTPSERRKVESMKEQLEAYERDGNFDEE